MKFTKMQGLGNDYVYVNCFKEKIDNPPEVATLCDISISIDCDGQDDISAMTEMVKQYLAGNDVVYGVRSSRETDTVFKRFTAQAFYCLLEKMGVECIYNHADYRLLSARVLKSLQEYQEVNLFEASVVCVTRG